MVKASCDKVPSGVFMSVCVMVGGVEERGDGLRNERHSDGLS